MSTKTASRSSKRKTSRPRSKTPFFSGKTRPVGAKTSVTPGGEYMRLKANGTAMRRFSSHGPVALLQRQEVPANQFQARDRNLWNDILFCLLAFQINPLSGDKNFKKNWKSCSNRRDVPNLSDSEKNFLYVIQGGVRKWDRDLRKLLWQMHRQNVPEAQQIERLRVLDIQRSLQDWYDKYGAKQYGAQKVTDYFDFNPRFRQKIEEHMRTDVRRQIQRDKKSKDAQKDKRDGPGKTVAAKYYFEVFEGIEVQAQGRPAIKWTVKEIKSNDSSAEIKKARAEMIYRLRRKYNKCGSRADGFLCRIRERQEGSIYNRGKGGDWIRVGRILTRKPSR